MKRPGSGSVARDGRPVARRAHRGVLAAEGLRVEARTVRVEPAAALGGVAAETVPLRMTGDAALQVLASRLTVVQEKLRLGIVVSRSSQAIPWSRAPRSHDSPRRTATGCGSRRRTGRACMRRRDGSSGTRRDGIRDSDPPRWAGGNPGTGIATWHAAQLCGRADASSAWLSEKSMPCESGRFRSTRAPGPRPGPAACMASATVGAPGGSRDSSPACGRWRTLAASFRAGCP